MKIEVFQQELEHNIKINIQTIINGYLSSNADVCIFPECSTIGYLPKDLLFNAQYIQSCLQVNEEIISITGKKAIIFGSIIYKECKLYNAGIVAQNGKIIGISTKRNLPNTGVFNESRYFADGKPETVLINGVNFALLICEDVWHCDSYKDLQSVDVFCAINASPFEVCHTGKTKLQQRLDVIKKRVETFQKPFIYCNGIGLYNGIVFDGNSFIFNGEFTRLPQFQQARYTFELSNNATTNYNIVQNIIAEKHNAIIYATRKFFEQSRQQKAIVGFSGGADSALVATLAMQALGKDNVLCVGMPSKHTSRQSIQDASTLAHNLEVQVKYIDIQSLVDSYKKTLNLEGVALENIQARIRGDILMAISNQEQGLVLSTGNKSEVAVGYCTLYGDMCGAFNPIKDLYKTEVVSMLKYINLGGKIIPESIIIKEPTAELRDNQKDSDSLPRYEILDEILMQLIESGRQPSEITNFDTVLTEKIFSMLKGSEFKRWQTCPGIKLSFKSFERDDWKFSL